ncbi:MAG: amidohydrolase family protein [Acidobacteria bacterium]|nr:amidohydrolase family protein [Acidobacteriota bacterium]MBV9476630.1 amidohydrolase family protein [Acidobacteriota bacterium]
MKRIALLLLLAATLEARPIAIVNVNVIAMTSDAVTPSQTVIVDRGRIVTIGSVSTTPVPDGAQTIDGQGGYLIPGLCDLHVHLTDRDDLALYVANGVTTVFNLDGDESTLALRKAPPPLAPRILTAGPKLIGVPGAERARAIVAEQAAAGYDAIKIYDDIAADALPELVRVAREKGLLSIGHIPRNLKWQDMLAARPDAIAHAEEFLYSPVLDGDEERIAASMKANGTSLIATLITYDTIGLQVDDVDAMLARPENAYANVAIRNLWSRANNRYASRWDASKVPTLRRRLVFQKTLVRQLGAAGIPILLGTDAGGVPFVIPGFSAIAELRELVSAGLTPYAALRAATAGAAHFIRRDQDLGTIEAGKIADLVLLRGNPLANIDDVALRAGVMTNGEWHDEAQLQGALAHVAEINAAEAAVVTACNGTIDACVAAARKIRPRDTTLNELAYQLLYISKRKDDAVRLFRANAELHPESAIARGSLAEVVGKKE